MNYLKKNINSIVLGCLLGLILTIFAENNRSESEVYIKEVSTQCVINSEPLIELQTEIPTEAVITEFESLGEFKLTAYCPCEKCCGKSDGITFTGTKATQGRTIAVDNNVIPYGTTVIINGNEYVAEDTGGAIKGNIIDIFFNNHEEALEFGVQSAEIFVEVE